MFTFSHDQKKFKKLLDKGLNSRYRHLVDPLEGKMNVIQYAESLKYAKLAKMANSGRKDKISEEEIFFDFVKELCGKPRMIPDTNA